MTAHALPTSAAAFAAQAGAERPIGVFDSGVGGLSVLRALRAELPHERFVYVADSGHAPYGERGDAYVAARTHAITAHMLAQHGVKALVVACNTATAAAVHEVRSRYPALPLIGLEPAIKPALAATRTGRVGVIGTRGTLTSAKFGRLMASLQGGIDFVVQPCDGLAHAIERSVDRPVPAQPEGTETWDLCARYIAAMGAFGTAPGAIDTLVLGCTHYIFVERELRALVGPEVRFIETGEAVARQTRRLLEAPGLLAAAPAATGPQMRLFTTGGLPQLQAAARRWLDLPASTCQTVDIASDLPEQSPA